MFTQLWNDEHGGINVAAYLLLVTLLGIGGIVGLDTLRMAVLQEYGDVGLALENIDQTYRIEYELPDGTLKSCEYIDSTPGNDDPGAPPPGITVSMTPKDEGTGGGIFDQGTDEGEAL